MKHRGEWCFHIC